MEVFHFLHEVKTNFTRKVEFHLLLMNSIERLYFPVGTYLWLTQRLVEFNISNADINIGKNVWKIKVPKDTLYHDVLPHCQYQHGFSRNIKFTRHVAENQYNEGDRPPSLSELTNPPN